MSGLLSFKGMFMYLPKPGSNAASPGQPLLLLYNQHDLLPLTTSAVCSPFYYPSDWRSDVPLRTQLMDPSVQFSSFTQSCLTLCDPMNRSTPGLPVPHQLPEFTQIHVHRVRDAIQPSHPWSSPSPPAPNPSQHQSLFQ